MGAWLLVAAGVAVVASIAAAIAVIGTPAEQRLKRIDERRVRDLMALEAAVDAYRTAHGRLPGQLEALQAARTGREVRLRDAQTGAVYGYRRLDASRYELCAGFATATRERTDDFAWGGEWSHPAGRYCFVRSAASR
jgi:type II secretory pathway pseudopilin PulG